MKRDYRLYLDDIVDSVDKIATYTAGMSEEDFYHNEQVQDAVLRRVEIIGEAVKHLPKGLREEHPEIPWQEIAGTRDILTHGYFGFQLRSAWYIVQHDLPELRERIVRLRDSS
ncbi:MAG: DUF86 domain-containing protein [Chloroflexi bacterium]|nr:DUF86 domain-containing protein [Chloroflexota bacterium]